MYKLCLDASPNPILQDVYAFTLCNLLRVDGYVYLIVIPLFLLLSERFKIFVNDTHFKKDEFDGHFFLRLECSVLLIFESVYVCMHADV